MVILPQQREVVYEFSSNIAVAYRKVHTSLKFAQLSGSYVVVQDFPSIIGEEETLQRELEELQSLQSLTNILSNGIELSKKEI